MTTTISDVLATTWPKNVVPAPAPPNNENPEFVSNHVAEVIKANKAAYQLNPAPKTLSGLFNFLPDVASLEKWQTPIRSQGERGTCYAFAACAAMEAAYRRQYGVELNLSEQFAFHINKAGELYPGFHNMPTVLHENNSSLWGFEGSSDIVGKLARSAIPRGHYAPYLSDAKMRALRQNTPAAGQVPDQNTSSVTQPELDAFEFAEGHIPLASRHRARYRVTGFHSLGADPSDLAVQATIYSGHEVVADIEGHCYLVIGYDRPKKRWLVKNSQGQRKFQYVPFGNPKILGAHYITSVTPPDSPAQKDAWWIGRWNVDHDGWSGQMVIRRTTDYRQPPHKPTKLGTYYRDGKARAVNGMIEDGGQQLHFWIADTTKRVPAGKLTGQEFRAYIFSWDPGKAAGQTWWSGIPFGLSMNRQPVAIAPSSSFSANEWIGSWRMNHDGWGGLLEISSISPVVRVRYTPSGGEPLDVMGTLVSPHELRLMIAFPDRIQPFTLFAHTRENGRFSGTTRWGGGPFGWGGRKFGVQGHRRR